MSESENKYLRRCNRELAPLKKAEDAIEIDTSLMNAEEVANKIVELTMKVVGGDQ